jgi:DNA-binding winged helix-turn-helix (wHTH) protein/tetratricopeptide (TPR) repeat protein
MSVADRVNLAHEPDFVLGRLTASPSRRELVRDDGEREVIEHRVMQVLIALSKAEGSIVTRDELTMSCWDGRVVGEDAIHRVLSRLRKVANGIGAGSIEIETITKIGYRLTSNAGGAMTVGVPAAQGRAPSVTGLRWTGKRKIAAIAMAATMLVAAGLSGWAFLGRNSLPLVAVGPANSSPSSSLLARDLFVKLGTLPQLASGQWRLVEAMSARSTPNLLFRTAVTGPDNEPHATLTLLDGRNDNLLWSREFGFPANRDGDLRQHLSLTAARVLACALEARRKGGLPPDLLRLFLNGCAAMAETSGEEPQRVAGIMRTIVRQRPRFIPAWGRLLMADGNILQVASNDGDATELRKMLRRDIEAARRIAPDLPEIKLAEIDLLPPGNYAEVLAVVQRLKAKTPDKSEVWAAEAGALGHVGRMADAVESARQAAELSPLSPAFSSQLISALAWSGATEAAREELGRIERLWPGTGALRDAQFAFHLRYGDPAIARRLTANAGYVGHWNDPYLQARMEPSAANIDHLLMILERLKLEGESLALTYAVQALGEFHRTDEAFDWLLQSPPAVIADNSYVLFRPALADVRRDPRFMQVAKRIGLVDYWQKSGHWPDYCFDTTLPYECRQEAARLNS